MPTTGRGLAVSSPKLIYSEDGENCYAYKRTAASTTASTILSFTSGPGMINGWIQFNGFVQPSNPATGAIGTLDVMFNGESVIILKTETEVEDSPPSVRCPIIIPPLTAVTASIDCSATEAAMFATIVLIGDVSPVPVD